MYKNLHDGADLLSYSQKIDRKNALPHRAGIDLYTKRVRSKDYVQRLLGKYKGRYRRKKGATIGWMPIRRSQVEKPYLELETNRRNSQYPGVISAKLEDWLKEGTVQYVGNMDKLGPNWLKRNVRCILPYVVEEKKPRYFSSFLH